MDKNTSNRLWRISLATMASGVGYVYHAMSQERSVKSKIIQDGLRLRREASHFSSADKKKQATIDAAKNPKNHESLFFITQSESSKIHQSNHGVLIDVDHQKGSLSEKPWVIYFHGGKGIDTLRESEWRVLNNLQEEIGDQASLSTILLKSMANNRIADEVKRLMALLVDMAEKTGRSLDQLYFVASDSGAIPALLVADQFNQEGHDVEKVILLSPWLNTTYEDVHIKKTDAAYDATKVNAIKSMWAVKNPQLNYAKMPIDYLPAITTINGTDDSLACDGHWLHKRLRAHNKPSRYYQFDHMHHEFFLNRIPEADEVVTIIKEEILNHPLW